MGRKSTAQPRPVLNVPPRGIGPIANPNENDVLCGRGGRINSHAGNVKFRDVINARKKEYLAPTTKKLEKAHIAAAIVNDIRAMDPPGRFLKEDRDTHLWFDIGDAKAIKKTGQALREDAPDIRHELEGDSSGDEKGNLGGSPKKEKSTDSKEKLGDKPKSPPKVTPATAPTKKPASRQNLMVSGRGPQHLPVPWQPGNGGQNMRTPQDYQAQVAMPPPYSHQVNPYMQSQALPARGGQTEAFETRTIPIQSPMPHAIYSLPNQLVTGAKSVGRRVANASRHAMDALSHSGGHGGEQQANEMPEDVAFGRQFHPPAATVLSSDNTMSTISGITENNSSMVGGGAPSGSAISGLSGFSGISGMDTSAISPRNSGRAGHRDTSLRVSHLGLGASAMGPSSRSQFIDAMRASRMSDLTASASGRSMGSMTRSLSFNDMNSIADNETWNPIMEDEAVFGEAQAPEQSLLSGEASGPFSLASARLRDSSAMSIASFSTASSSRWLAGLKDTAMIEDGRSVLSEMSSDLHALDLAHPGDPKP